MAFAAGGAAGGAAQQATTNGLTGRPIGEHVVQATAIGAATGVVAYGAGRYVLKPIADKVLPKILPPRFGGIPDPVEPPASAAETAAAAARPTGTGAVAGNPRGPPLGGLGGDEAPVAPRTAGAEPTGSAEPTTTTTPAEPTTTASSGESGASGTPSANKGMAKTLEDLSSSNAKSGSGSGEATGSGEAPTTASSTPANTPASVTPRTNGLSHLTNDAGKQGIEASGVVRGRSGIFALDDDVANNAGRVERFLRTGIDPDKTANVVQLPENATSIFRPVRPIGPYSTIKWLGGTRYAPPGEINMTTGEFTPTPGAGWKPIAALYGPDALIYGTGLGTYGYFELENNSAPAPAPAPPPKKSPASP